MSCPTPNRIVHCTMTDRIKFFGRKQWDQYKFHNHLRPLYEVPCLKCLSCRLAKKSEWAARILQEASCHNENCFITLTYEDAPKSLNHRDWQLFVKRLRKYLEPKKISFFMAGEYGDASNTRRPHFHAILFGHDFMDKFAHHRNKKGNVVYTSNVLEKLWGKGFVQVGDVTFDSAAYCASYITKKVDGEVSEDYYEGIKPEYAVASKGVGLSWLKKYPEDVEGGELHLPDRTLPVPRYYKKKIEEMCPEKYERIRDARVKKGVEKNNRMLDKGLSPLIMSEQKAAIKRLKHKKREGEI